MQVKLIPQIYVHTDDYINYHISEHILNITVCFDGTIYKETFDFNGLEDGKLVLFDMEGQSTIDTSLPFPVLLEAEQINGEMYLDLIYWIREDEEMEVTIVKNSTLDILSPDPLPEPTEEPTEPSNDGEGIYTEETPEDPEEDEEELEPNREHDPTAVVVEDGSGVLVEGVVE